MSKPSCQSTVPAYGLTIGACFSPTSLLPLTPWRDAVTQCNLHQGHLVVINDTTKQDFVMRLMAELNVTTTWIGGRLNVVNTWTWVSDDSALQHQGCYTDDASNWDLPYRITVMPLTPAGCISACRQSRYQCAATQVRTSCDREAQWRSGEISAPQFTE
ncbi:hypothetical protein NP493_194g06002 [Ridgeia piscesae]|uniref:C-type lectin domain-containing protein n=1 Tax=Ridgeia piscesae TaxID=27915 RepID=A0AAD9UEQ9_RIDPI|nr:hypothetical protein NP493_194g06002 [Ridgeia piscesae]